LAERGAGGPIRGSLECPCFRAGYGQPGASSRSFPARLSGLWDHVAHGWAFDSGVGCRRITLTRLVDRA